MSSNRPRVVVWMIAGISLILAACQGKCPSPTPTTGVQIATAGGAHTCASSWDGTMRCWGDNTAGQLGNSTQTPSRVPVEVTGLTAGPVNRPVLRDAAAGGMHTCIVASNGKVFCWGDNTNGQLGLNSQTPFSTMQPARDLNNSSSGPLANLIAAGENHTCAVYEGDRVGCWGRKYSLFPTEVQGITALHIAAGGDQTCVIVPGGAIKCWGGLLNFGPATNPTVIQGITGKGAIAVGRSHACAIDQADTIKCWGQNGFGQLGNGGKVASATPVAVSTTSTAAAIGLDAGDFHTCALFSSGAVECWGMNSTGQTGDTSTTSSVTLRPFQVRSSGAIGIAVGTAHSCAVFADGSVHRMECWGSNSSGQLGDGSNSTFSLTPVRVTGLP